MGPPMGPPPYTQAQESPSQRNPSITIPGSPTPARRQGSTSQSTPRRGRATFETPNRTWDPANDLGNVFSSLTLRPQAGIIRKTDMVACTCGSPPYEHLVFLAFMDEHLPEGSTDEVDTNVFT